MAMMESNETKFYAWLKTNATIEQRQEIRQATCMVSLLLMQKKVTKKPLFLLDDTEEVAKIASRVASCFASSKARRIALRIVTLYASYLKMKLPQRLAAFEGVIRLIQGARKKAQPIMKEIALVAALLAFPSEGTWSSSVIGNFDR